MNLGTAQPHIACYLIFEKDNRVAFLLRSGTGWMDDHYGLVAGKIEKGESFKQGATREAKEEAGIDLEPSNIKHILIMHRHDAESNIKFWVDVFFEVKDWTGELINAEPHMHSELAWLDPLNLPDNVISSIKYALETINNGETYAEYGWDS